jgi:flagellar FliJ protein
LNELKRRYRAVWFVVNWGGILTLGLAQMSAREKLIRQKRMQVSEVTRKIAQIEAMIAELEQLGSLLARDIKIEEDRSGIHDPANFAYSTYAKTARQRHENIQRSIRDLGKKLDALKITQAEATGMLESLFRLNDSKLRQNSGVSLRKSLAFVETPPATAG